MGGVNMQKTSLPTTVPATAGKSPTTQPLAKTYLDWQTSPRCPRRFNDFGDALDIHLREMLPDGVFSGLLNGRECDIRQDAATDLINRFLFHSPRLRAAVAAKNLKRIGHAIEQCTRNCLCYCRKRILDDEKSHKGEALPQETLEDATSEHEQEHQMRRRIAQLLKSPVAAKELAEGELRLLRRLIVDEATREEVGEELGKSPSWISKRLGVLQKKMRKSQRLRRILEADM